MDIFIKYLKVLAIPIGTTLILPLFLSLFNLFGLKTSNILILVLMVITMIISGFIIGKKANKKGYINGLVLGFITSLLLFLMSLVFKNNYEINTIIYYSILTVASIVGSMFGINKKTNG